MHVWTYRNVRLGHLLGDQPLHTLISTHITTPLSVLPFFYFETPCTIITISSAYYSYGYRPFMHASTLATYQGTKLRLGVDADLLYIP
jgi:hypothetical protein